MKDLVTQVGEGRARLDRINYKKIMLISKKEALTQLGDYRSIALLNSSLKIISKVLTSGQSLVIGGLIVDYQYGFIKSKSILKGIVVTKKVIHQCRRTGHKDYLLKLDLENVYDTVKYS